MNVLCLWHATAEEIETIRRAMPKEAHLIVPEGPYFSRFECRFEDVKTHLRDADVLIGFALPKGTIEAAESLKLLVWLHSGVDDLDNLGVLRLAREREFKVANVSGANGTAVAEHAMMMLLALAKKMREKHEYMLEGYKSFPAFGEGYRSSMLQGRTIGIVGMGGIGSRIARYAKVFEMTVLGVRNDPARPNPNVDRMYGADNLTEVLPQCDYLVLAVPSTPDTVEMIGEKELSLLKPSALLVSVCRAVVIQEMALYDALVSGRLRGFASDVWWKYETGRSFPAFWGSRLRIQKLPNVLASYDQASHADGVLESVVEMGCQSIRQFFEGSAITKEVLL